MFLSTKLLIVYYKGLKMFSPWEFCMFALVSLLWLQKTELICLSIAVLPLKIIPIAVSSKLQYKRMVLCM